MERMKSPSPASSTLITSAPSSPSSPAQNGAEIRVPTSTTRMPFSGPRPSSATRQPQHPLAHQRALNLVGAREDGGRLVIEPRALPGAVVGVARGALPQRRGRAEDVERRLVQPLGHLAPVQLEGAALGAGCLTLGEPGERAPVVQLEEADLGGGLSQLLAQAPVVEAPVV